ncbi:potassium channel, sub T, member 2 [Allomyces javanicus]|nr:potassium channel, sub T, member 2 [Allomyces javanicus]
MSAPPWGTIPNGHSHGHSARNAMPSEHSPLLAADNAMSSPTLAAMSGTNVPRSPSTRPWRPTTHPLAAASLAPGAFGADRPYLYGSGSAGGSSATVRAPPLSASGTPRSLRGLTRSASSVTAAWSVAHGGRHHGAVPLPVPSLQQRFLVMLDTTKWGALYVAVDFLLSLLLVAAYMLSAQYMVNERGRRVRMPEYLVIAEFFLAATLLAVFVPRLLWCYPTESALSRFARPAVLLTLATTVPALVLRGPYRWTHPPPVYDHDQASGWIAHLVLTWPLRFLRLLWSTQRVLALAEHPTTSTPRTVADAASKRRRPRTCCHVALPRLSPVHIKVLALISGVVCVLLTLAATLHIIEFQYAQMRTLSFFDAFFFTSLIATTISYDSAIVPDAPFPRITILVMILTGLTFVPYAMTQLMEAAALRSKYDAPLAHDPHQRHVVVVGSGAALEAFTLRHFLGEFLSPAHGPAVIATKVVILAPQDPPPNCIRVLRAPAFRHRVQWIRGSALSIDAVVDRADVPNAAACFVLARKYAAPSSRSVDAENVVRAMALAATAVNVPLFVQCLLPDSVPHFDWFAQTVVCTDQLKLAVLARSALCPGFSTLVYLLTTSVSTPVAEGEGKWDDVAHSGSVGMYAVNAHGSLAGTAFADVALAVYADLALPVVAVGTRATVGIGPLAVHLAPFAYVLDGTETLFLLATNQADADRVAEWTKARCVAVLTEVDRWYGAQEREQQQAQHAPVPVPTVHVVDGVGDGKPAAVGSMASSSVAAASSPSLAAPSSMPLLPNADPASSAVPTTTFAPDVSTPSTATTSTTHGPRARTGTLAFVDFPSFQYHATARRARYASGAPTPVSPLAPLRSPPPPAARALNGSVPPRFGLALTKFHTIEGNHQHRRVRNNQVAATPPEGSAPAAAAAAGVGVAERLFRSRTSSPHVGSDPPAPLRGRRSRVATVATASAAVDWAEVAPNAWHPAPAPVVPPRAPTWDDVAAALADGGVQGLALPEAAVVAGFDAVVESPTAAAFPSANVSPGTEFPAPPPPAAPLDPAALHAHVLVCVPSSATFPANLEYLLSSLRDGARALDDDEEADGTLVPVVILSAAVPSHDEWQVLDAAYRGCVAHVRGSPLVPRDLVRAGAPHASRVVVLADDAAVVGAAGREKLEDANAIMAVFNLKAVCSPNTFIVAEFVHNETMRFLTEHDVHMDAAAAAADMYGGDSIAHRAPSFMAGNVFTVSMLDSVIAQAFYTPHLVAVLKRLLGTDTATHPNDARTSAHVVQVAVPAAFIGSPLKHLAVAMLRGSHGVRRGVVLGLYRLARVEPADESEEEDEDCVWFRRVMVAPPPWVVLNAEDRVFVLAHPMRGRAADVAGYAEEEVAVEGSAWTSAFGSEDGDEDEDDEE